jgi:hypothetical protein
VKVIALGHRVGRGKVNQYIATSGITAPGENRSYDFVDGPRGARTKFTVT